MKEYTVQRNDKTQKEQKPYEQGDVLFGLFVAYKEEELHKEEFHELTGSPWVG
jgi:hypothetical protein